MLYFTLVIYLVMVCACYAIICTLWPLCCYTRIMHTLCSSWQININNGLGPLPNKIHQFQLSWCMRTSDRKKHSFVYVLFYLRITSHSFHGVAFLPSIASLHHISSILWLRLRPWNHHIFLHDPCKILCSKKFPCSFEDPHH